MNLRDCVDLAKALRADNAVIWRLHMPQGDAHMFSDPYWGRSVHLNQADIIAFMLEGDVAKFSPMPQVANGALNCVQTSNKSCQLHSNVGRPPPCDFLSFSSPLKEGHWALIACQLL